ncbi:MAG: response regulator [Deltaproteobacteria bacterium]|nr:response regulator [Deltaproteobacteria bacterium]
MNTVIRDFLSILRRTVRENIVIVDHLCVGTAPILCDQVQIEQVLLNLVVNAQDVMENGGVIKVITSSVIIPVGGGAYENVRLKTGKWVSLTIRDTGPGIPESIKTRIFEPFFTTKDSGKGTGLGLSTVYGIVHQHGGEIVVGNAKKGGTEFVIFFPSSSPAITQEIKTVNIQKNTGGTETILIVEDQPQVRNLAKSILKKFGYNIIACESSDEAVELVETFGSKIHLLLTDVVMPGADGKQLFEKIKSDQKGLKVLYMSGYSSDILTESDTDNGRLFISKPFTIDGLLLKVREILNDD